MKRCTHCGIEKPLTEFPPVRRGEPKLQSWCRACFAEANAAYYARNREREKARLLRQVDERRAEVRRNIVSYLVEHPCVDCGESDVVVLEFDHLRDKIDDLATLANGGRSWQRVAGEIAKCEVRCANCHRRATALRRIGPSPASLGPSRQGRQLTLASAITRRVCRVCALDKPLAEFPFRSISSATHQWICLACQRAFARAWYASRVGRPVRSQRPRRSGPTRPELVAYVFSYLTAHECVDCGEPDALLLDFDHRGEKVAAVSDLIRMGPSWSELIAEMEKCDIRCANCHRRKTVRMVEGYRWLLSAATRKGLEPLALTFVV